MTLDRDARRCALQAMYQFDAGSSESLDVVRESLDGSPATPEARIAGFDLAQGAWEHRAESDTVMERQSPDWPVRRQPMVDRNLLRLAFHEMHRRGTPPKVVINEAVEIAKTFSTSESSAFINGILDRVVVT